MDHCRARFGCSFVVLVAVSSTSIEPGEGSFEDPSLGQYDKPHCIYGTTHGFAKRIQKLLLPNPAVREIWVRRIKQERRELGKTAPCLKRKRIPKWARHSDQIQTIVNDRSDITLNELKQALGTELSTKTLCIALQNLKLTYKKSSRCL